ncbi:MAG: hypothetical protein ACJ76A_05815 [Actinomycetota bacterium]|jgi:hypothetical protein
MTFRTLSKRAIITSLFLGILLAGSVAFAWWTAGGTGNGYAKAATASPLTTVDVSASTTNDLYPGGDGTLTIQIHNPNTYAVTVNSITATGPGTSGVAACTAANTVTMPTAITGQSIPVPAGGDSLVLTYPGAVHMSLGGSADNSCQGLVFSIPVTLTGVNS